MASKGADAIGRMLAAAGRLAPPPCPRLAQPVASCSGRGASHWAGPSRRQSGPQQRDPKPVCTRAASEGDEEVVAPRNPYVEEPEVVKLAPRHRNQGPGGKQVEKTFVEAMFTDEIDVEDTNFWFTAPEGGWDQEEEEVWNLEEVEPDPITAANFGPGRTELADLEEGAVMTGEVTCLMFYHGVQVDLGAQYDGLIPVLRDQWANEHFQAKFGVSSGVADDFEIGQTVTVRIHRINMRPRCRWPIQLEVLQPDVQHKLTPPDEYRVPFDLRGVRSFEEAFRITGRRDYAPAPRGGWLSPDELATAKAEMGSPGVAAVSQGAENNVTYAGRSLLQDVFQELERLRLADLKAAEEEAGPRAVHEDEELYEEDYS